MLLIILTKFFTFDNNAYLVCRYAILRSCWNSNYKERPNFTEIRQMLENILERKSEYLNLNLTSSFGSLDELKVADVESKVVSSERYVKAFAS